MSDRRARQLTSIGLGVILAAGLGGRADALPRYGPLELAGSVAAYQLIRHPDIDEYNFIMQRNTVLLRADLSMIEKGRMLDQVNIPGIERPSSTSSTAVCTTASMTTLRVRSEGHLGQKDQHRTRRAVVQHPRPVQVGEPPARSVHRLRRAELPLNFRIGRQQIVWGETDNFRMLDRVNPLDLTWHLQQETWDQTARPHVDAEGHVAHRRPRLHPVRATA